MLTVRELRAIASARLCDSEALYQAGRYDGSAYLCGYVVELALKARICRTLKWPGFPKTSREFQGLASFKIHDLEMLLKLAGWGGIVRAKYMSAWSVVLKWKPENRYDPVGTTNRTTAKAMLESAAILLKKL